MEAALLVMACLWIAPLPLVAIAILPATVSRRYRRLVAYHLIGNPAPTLVSDRMAPIVALLTHHDRNGLADDDVDFDIAA